MSSLRLLPAVVPRAGVLLVAALSAALSASPLPAQSPAGPLWQLTYLKAKPGKRADLAACVEANWFVTDRRAHTPVLINGQGFRDLGTVVQSVATRQRPRGS